MTVTGRHRDKVFAGLLKKEEGGSQVKECEYLLEKLGKTRNHSSSESPGRTIARSTP